MGGRAAFETRSLGQLCSLNKSMNKQLAMWLRVRLDVQAPEAGYCGLQGNYPPVTPVANSLV